ncbi:MAG: iron ABC transporter permease [Alphaproteobacteria bacterium]|nr:iron ABC transporter permease [Alphaproteobacteria bacterium]MCW5740849.1 iron ABC transporter permease [Alphaproteobacteria bacterium]
MSDLSMPAAAAVPRRVKRHLALMAFGIALALAFLCAVGFGAVRILPGEMLGIVLRALGATIDVDQRLEAVFLAIRLPRAVLALVVGAGLGIAGASMQGMFRNPLADPGLIGVSAGAALAAVAVIVLGGSVLHLITPSQRPWFLPGAAFIGGLIATGLVYRLGTRGGTTSVATMLLAGIAVNALAAAGIGFLTYIADENQLRLLVFWTMGSLGAASWGVILPALPLVVIPALLLLRHHRALDAMALGEREASHLGIEVEDVKTRIVVLVALSVGGAVSVSGIIGFVGLVVPHLVRLIGGPRHALVLPGAAMLGGALMLSADLLARLVMAPAEMPVGIVMAALGAPVFLSIMARRHAATAL